MANNPALYNAVIAGIIGGNQHRLTLSNNPDFTIFQAAAKIVADAVDDKIATMDSMNGSYVALMQSICQGIFQNQSVEAIRHELPTIAQNIADLFNMAYEALEEVESDSVGQTIPLGTYEGQPVHWDGDSWQPLPPGNTMVFNKWSNDGPGIDEKIGVQLDGASGWIGIGVGEELVKDPALENAIELKAGTSGIVISDTGIKLDYAGNSLYLITETSHDFQIQGDSILKLTYEGGETRIGFFGATPVPVQSVTGTNEADTLESLITALVNLGLISDDRV